MASMTPTAMTPDKAVIRVEFHTSSNICRRTKPFVFAREISTAKMLLSNDAGATHASAASFWSSNAEISSRTIEIQVPLLL